MLICVSSLKCDYMTALLLILLPMFIVIGLISALYIFLSKKYDFLITISKPLPLVVIFLLSVAVGPSSPLFEINLGRYIGFLLFSVIIGSFGIVFYNKFKLVKIKESYSNLLSTSMFIPLVLSLVVNLQVYFLT